jgi:hypothetical protein
MFLLLGAIMHNNFGKNIKGRMPSLHTKDKHLIRLEEHLINFPECLILLMLMTVITNGPDKRQTQILLIHIKQSPLDHINNGDSFHDIIGNLIQIGLHDSLK